MRLIYIFLILILLTGCSKEKAKEQYSVKLVMLKNKNPLLKSEKLIPPLPLTSYFSIFDIYKTDKNGIVMLEKDKSKPFYYPILYSRVALAEYQAYYKTKEEKHREKFMKYVNFIYKSRVDINNFSVWQCNQPVKPYNLKTPWSSAMAQGYILSVMIQAYSLTQDKKYLELAKRAVKAYKQPIEKGGCSNDWNGTPFYEEYADPDSHVLNGNIFSLYGLYYFYYNYNNKEAKQLFDQGIKSLQVKLKEYDADFTSFYNKQTTYKFSSTIGKDPDHYHELVIRQLLTLYYWTNKDFLKEYAHLFLRYDLGNMSSLHPQNKFKKIVASYTIEPKNYGVNRLNDELYSWGKYWSFYKYKTNLDIDFNGVKNNISDIVFYSNSFKSLPEKYQIFIKNKDNYQYVCDNTDINGYVLRKYKTGKFKSFIQKITLPKKYKGNGIRIRFIPHDETVYKLTEINIFFDRYDVLEDILNFVKNNSSLPNKK